MTNDVHTQNLVVVNEKGLHARPATLFVQAASTFHSDIRIRNLDSQTEADGKSVMSMLLLAAPRGTRLELTASGADSAQAVKVLGALVNRGFDDDNA